MGQGRPAAKWGGRVFARTPFVLSLFLVLGAWWAYTALGHVQGFLVPSPESVLSALYDGLVTPTSVASGFLWNLGVTLETTVIGFVIGSLLGGGLAVLAATSPTANGIIMPYAAALQALPKIAVAPLLLLWFGFGIQSKVLLVILLVFFPVLVNTYRGVRETDVLLLDLMRSLGATRRQTLTQVQLPYAMPYIFAGLNVGVIDALLGAIVGEFVGASAGIGVLLIQYQADSAVAASFAALIILGIVGAVLSGLVELARRHLLTWAP